MFDNRNGLVVCTELLLVNGTAERDAAMQVAERLPGDGRVTVGASGPRSSQPISDLRQTP